MADETPEEQTPEEQPKPRRRRKKPPKDTPASEARRADQAEGGGPARDAKASEPDVSSEASPDEIEPTPEDVKGEEEAADVVLEAEAEIDEDSEPEPEAEEPKPARPARSRRPRRQRAAEPEAEQAADEPDEPEAEEAADEPEAAEEPEAPAKGAPRRRRSRRESEPGPPPIVRAQAKYVRTSPRKARLVCDHIRGKSVEDARAILAHAPRAVARDWSKLLESAVANAEHNHELVGEDLFVKTIQADEGPTIKRYRPRALGRATRIRKRTSHLTILLTPKD
jgi:ribosomal protein L22